MQEVAGVIKCFVKVHAPSEEKCDLSKEELEQVFDHFPQYHTKILLEGFKRLAPELFF